MLLNLIKTHIYNKCTEEVKLKLRRIYMNAYSFFYKNNLQKLAIINGSDKFGLHFYTQHYEFHFKKIRNERLKILEIGVGGHNNPFVGGGSLRMWKHYFKRSNIFSIDIYEKKKLEEHRINIFKGNQIDKEFLLEIANKTNGFNIIIDDGSHVNKHVITTFEILFPFLKDGGFYVIEDTQTSYWPEFGGDSTNLNDVSTIMGYFKKYIDCVNYQEILTDEYNPTYFDINIAGIYFYHNLIFIKKGRNIELSNVVENGKIISEIIVEN